MALSRREVLAASVASGAVLLSRPSGAAAARLGPDADTSASRTSKLDPNVRLAHADLHNHTLLSDGDGRADAAFETMRSHGLDVAALTDHSGVGKVLGPTCQGCDAAIGIDESEWDRLKSYADAANADGEFVALRGFEWSSPVLGHMNVWFSATWTDPLATAGVNASSTAGFLLHEDDTLIGPDTEALLNDVLRGAPDRPVSMAGFYDWLDADPERAIVGGGLDGIAGFNHPGREGGRFGYFTYDPRIADRVVSIEMFNRREDYLFEGVAEGNPSPLVECLDAGWRVGILGVTDEHGDDWGGPLGKGRTGLWVPRLSRDTVRDAMESRRFFATRERGLRLDATANGTPMGGRLAHRDGEVRFALDIDKGREWQGRTLLMQVMQTGDPLPTLTHQVEFRVPGPDEPAVAVTVPVSRDDGDWVVLRVTDPSRSADDRAQPYPAYRAAGRAVAYASPFFLVENDEPPTSPDAVSLTASSLGVAGAASLRRAEHAHDHDRPRMGDLGKSLW
ncbi:CehA/McbA family metallohydrolase domain-containing protein [Haloechinothrix halophila]|uniref:hypothetical protein n=1 Tax=Haloechinothrix halophila TaxID=1069073 RepID=UPI0012F7F096|nr:hypothetical protein [Haloechinothrix halophila]